MSAGVPEEDVVFSPAEVSGCSHSRDGRCLNCLDGVRVPAAVFRRVSAAFVGVGALPPVSAGEA